MSSLLALAGKVALVTGSSRSIGAAIANRLADDGANVVVNYFSNSHAADDVVNAINARGKGKAVGIQADATTPSGVKSLLDGTLEAFGKLDILVLNAGIMGSRVLADIDEEFFDAHIRANVKGPLFLTKEAAPLLTAGGRIIFISTSITGATTVLPNNLVYASTKAAIEQITRILSKDLGTRLITVNVVSPGPMDTPLFRAGKSELAIQTLANYNPQKRLGVPEEVAPVVAFLASPAAKWVNGQNIRVNGVS